MKNQVGGRILINIHYYEQGNVSIGSQLGYFLCKLIKNQVQLSTIHAVSFNIPPAIVSSPDATKSAKILALIEDEERKYQISLNETYQEMKEKTFKGLRRALPLTRQKIDWDKVCYLSVIWMHLLT
jgi:capping protein (actin filament) muscle Z-line, alpha